VNQPHRADTGHEFWPAERTKTTSQRHQQTQSKSLFLKHAIDWLNDEQLMKPTQKCRFLRFVIIVSTALSTDFVDTSTHNHKASSRRIFCSTRK
jgi:hypothetical protein